MTDEANRIAQRMIRELDALAQSQIAMAHEACRAGDPYEVTRWTKLHIRSCGELHRMRQRWTPPSEY